MTEPENDTGRGAGERAAAPTPLARGLGARLAGSGWLQVAETSGARIYLVLVMLVSTSITARYLGPEGRGVLVAAQGWVGTFASIGYLSMAQPLFHRVSGRPAREWLPDALGALLVIVGMVTLLGWAVAAAGFWTTGGELYRRIPAGVLVAAFAALPFMLWGENGNSILLAMGKLRVLNLAQVVAGTASLVAVFLTLGVFRAGIGAALLAVAVNPLLLAVVGIVFMFREVSGVTAKWSVGKRLVADGARLHLNAIGSVLSGNATILILNHYRTPAETAYLQLAGQMLTGLSIIPAAVSSVAYTRIAREGANGAWPGHKRLLGQTLALMSVLCVVAYFLAPLGVRLIAGPEFLPTVPLFRLLLPTVILSTVAVGTVSQWVARGLFSWLAIYGVIIGVITAAAMYLLVPRYGMYGAVWVSLGTSALALVLNLVVVLWIDRQWRESVAHGG